MVFKNHLGTRIRTHIGTTIFASLLSPAVFAISVSEMEPVVQASALPTTINRYYIDAFGMSNDSRYTYYKIRNAEPNNDIPYDHTVIKDRFTNNAYTIDGSTSDFSIEGISGNGRFIFTRNGEIFDLKTGNTSNIQRNLEEDSLSDNGQYAAIYTYEDPLNIGVTCSEIYAYDFSSSNLAFVSAAYGTTNGGVCQQAGNFGISGDGSLIYWDSDSSDDSGFTYGPYANPINRDLFSVNWQVATDDTQRVSLANGDSEENTTSGGALYEPDYTADGLHVAFRSYFQYVDQHDPTGIHIYVRDVSSLATEAISVDANGDLVSGAYCQLPSISDDARYVVFHCGSSLVPGAGPGIYVRDRVTQTTQFVSEGNYGKISGDGQYILLLNGGVFLRPSTAPDDGIYIVGNPAARDPQDRPTYNSNYMYVTVPSSETNWQAFDSLTLVDNYLWKGKVAFDGVNGDAFKLDVGGNWVNGNIQYSGPWQNNYGDNNADGQLDANGSNITITQGPGVYEITFNESSLSYSVAKISDYNTLFIRGTNNNWGVTRMAYIGFNTWEAVVTFNGAHDERFKLDANGDWQINLGDNNADGTLDLNGADIYLPYASGKYRIQFYQDTMHYSVQAL